MGVMDRANQKLPKSGDWLDKDELIRLRTPLAIVDVRFDRAGTAKFPGENWILSLEPWDNAKFPGPTGLLRFKNLPTRQAQFEDIAEQLDEMKQQGVGYIGPVALVSGLSNAGNRFKTLADVTVDEAGEVIVDKKGFPKIEGEAEVEVGTPVGANTPATGPRRPTGSVQQQSTGQRERAQAAQGAEKPATAPAAAEAPAAQATPDAAPTPAPRRRGRPAAQPAPPAPGTPPEAVRYEQQAQAEAAAEAIGPSPAVQQVTQQIPMATATCPHCETEIGPNRVYPAAGGGYVIMHAHCPVKQDTVILAVDMSEGDA